MQKYILFFIVLFSPALSWADTTCTVDHPCTVQMTPEQQKQAIWNHHKQLSDAAEADQKQRAIEFERHRLEIKQQEKNAK